MTNIKLINQEYSANLSSTATPSVARISRRVQPARVGTWITRAASTNRQVHQEGTHNHKNLVGCKFNPRCEHQGGGKARHSCRPDAALQAHIQRHMNFEYGNFKLDKAPSCSPVEVTNSPTTTQPHARTDRSLASENSRGTHVRSCLESSDQLDKKGHMNFRYCKFHAFKNFAHSFRSSPPPTAS